MLLAVCLLHLFAFAVSSSPEPVLLGSLSTMQHGVSGSVYAVDEKTLMLKNFSYNGGGPEAFFLVGREGSPGAGEDESPSIILAHPDQGVHYQLGDAGAPVLQLQNLETINLSLPEDVTVSELKWISVWCPQCSADFGSLMFPENVEIPEPEPEAEAEPKAEPEPEQENTATAEPESEIQPKSEEASVDDSIQARSLTENTEPESEPEHGDASLLSSSLAKTGLLLLIIKSLQ